MIINTWDQNHEDRGDRIIIYYRPPIHGRGSQNAAWQVSRMRNGVCFLTDQKAPWYDHDLKTFDIYNVHKDKKDKLAEAIAWANSTYGQREFVRNRLGDYVEKEVNEKFPIPKREK